MLTSTDAQLSQLLWRQLRYQLIDSPPNRPVPDARCQMPDASCQLPVASLPASSSVDMLLVSATTIDAVMANCDLVFVC